ncbi:MAG: dienelactone hydrolase family protein [Endozoicomonas sp.]|uniref:dienelactone hydrolase family protein n=1 Tax=Endozoicomonas sp. TaxID=1892382 RepID=UPI003D9AC916
MNTTSPLFSLVNSLIEPHNQHAMVLSIASLFCFQCEFMDTGCLAARNTFPEFQEATCLQRRSWEEIEQEISHPIWFPITGSPPYPAIILLHGSSPAFSMSMKERRDFFLSQGYAVMIVDSFTRIRTLKYCFDKDQPCHAYLEARDSSIDRAMTLDLPESDLLTEIHKEMMNKVAKGYFLLPAERTADLFIALKNIRGYQKVDSNNLHIIGYSHGGSVVLDAMTMANNNLPVPAVSSLPADSFQGVQSVTAYYPNCEPGTYYQNFMSTPTTIPTLMVLAEKDTFVKPEICSNIVKYINRRSFWKPYDLETFSEGHAFDMKEYFDTYNTQSKESVMQKTLTFIQWSQQPRSPLYSVYRWLLYSIYPYQ